MSPIACNVGSGTGGVVSLHHFHFRVACKIVTALHERNGMRVHFGDGVPIVIGQAHECVFDVELVFAHHGDGVFQQEFVVVEQAPGDGVLDGHEGQVGRFVAQGLEHRLKGVATVHVQRGVAKIAASGNVVKRTENSLNGNVHSGENWREKCRERK